MEVFASNVDYQTKLLNRFVKYVKIDTESCGSKADEGIMPSSNGQFNLANILVSELRDLGFISLQVTKDCYVYGYLPPSPSCDDWESLLFLAHLDTVDEVSGRDVKPIIHSNYDGTRIDLQGGVTLDVNKDECLKRCSCVGDTIITSDGQTLLGADDKAGISEIVSAMEYLKEHPEINHGPIEVIFSPDEETGHGMDKVPLELIQSKRAYTVDGGEIGELEYECFNAYSCNIIFTGKSTHTGDARKKKMINANCAMAHFIESIPICERPETTDGYEGFYAVMETSGTIEKATVSLLLRDFSEEGMNNRIQRISQLAFGAASSYGATVETQFKETYKNMKGKIQEHPQVIDKLVQAYKDAGVTPVFTPIRGGTDGSRLTEMGLPTPNIFTGGHNYHSRSEWASLKQMSAASDVILNLCITK